MKANELMIGDWANVPPLNKSVRVGAVYHTMIIPNTDDDDVHASIGDEYLEPIPLTPEILEQNGWKWNEYHTMMTLVVGSIHIGWGFYKDCLSISDHSDDGNCQITSLKCKYVHQLQHVLRLCGIEKEIIILNEG